MTRGMNLGRRNGTFFAETLQKVLIEQQKLQNRAQQSGIPGGLPQVGGIRSRGPEKPFQPLGLAGQPAKRL